jgi:hypothetical protein
VEIISAFKTLAAGVQSPKIGTNLAIAEFRWLAEAGFRDLLACMASSPKPKYI